MMNIGQRACGIMWWQHAMRVCIWHSLVVMKFTGKPVGKIQQAVKTVHWFAIRKVHLQMADLVNVPADTNVMEAHQNGLVFGEWGLTTMQALRKTLSPDK